MAESTLTDYAVELAKAIAVIAIAGLGFAIAVGIVSADVGLL